MKQNVAIKRNVLVNKFFLAGLIASLAFAGCSGDHQKDETLTRYLVTNPIKKDTLILKDYVCQIHSIQHIEIRALEQGYLEKIFVDEGQFIQKGQLMFQIMPVVYQAELKKQQAEVNLIEIEYNNTKLLADSNVVSSNELAMIKAKLDKAKADLALAQAHLGFTEIRAPFDGIMDRFHVRVGSLLEEGELLTTLSDNSKMWVYFNVSEAEYLDFKTKSKDSVMKVNLIMANMQPFKYPGVVETIEADFDNETGNIAFRATFPNPDRLLRHGETGNIQLPVVYNDALIIPQKATFEILEKKYVFVVNNNRVEQKEIKIAGEMPDIYIIKNGIGEKDKILVEGIRKVRNNDLIDYEFKKGAAVLADLKVAAE